MQNLKIPQYKEQDPISDSISDSVMRIIIKFRAYPRIIDVNGNGTSNAPFNLSSMQANKVTQNTDNSSKLVKKNSDISSDFILENLNDDIL